MTVVFKYLFLVSIDNIYRPKDRFFFLHFQTTPKFVKNTALQEVFSTFSLLTDNLVSFCVMLYLQHKNTY